MIQLPISEPQKAVEDGQVWEIQIEFLASDFILESEPPHRRSLFPVILPFTLKKKSQLNKIFKSLYEKTKDRQLSQGLWTRNLGYKYV